MIYSGHSSRSLRAIYGNTRGAVLPMALMGIAMLAVLGISAIQTTTMQTDITANYKTAAQSLYAAEGGVYHVIRKYRNDPSLYTTTKTATEMGLPAAKPANANLGAQSAYWFPSLTYAAGNPPPYVDIESWGSVIGTTSLAKVVVRVAYALGNPWLYGFFGDEGVEMGGTALVDSYDSCAGPYDPLNPGSNVTIGTNATGVDALTLNGTSELNGNAVCGLGGDPTTDISGGTITGTTSEMSAPRDMTLVTMPTGGTPETLSLVGTNVKTLGTSSTATTYRLPEISLGASSTGYIDGDVTLYVDGDFDISANAQLVILPGASLTITVSGDIDVGGQGIVNTSTLPPNLLIYGTATTTSVTLRGTAEFYGAVYAPMADITLIGTSDNYGSFVGKTVTTTGTSVFHYDECLGNLTGGIGDGTFNIAFWRID